MSSEDGKASFGEKQMLYMFCGYLYLLGLPPVGNPYQPSFEMKNRNKSKKTGSMGKVWEKRYTKQDETSMQEWK